MADRRLTPDDVLMAYRQGYFPMAMGRDDPTLYWFHPETRGILPLNDFHIPRSLAKRLRKRDCTVTINHAFEHVIRACGERRGDTWINEPIIALFTALHERGHAHSLEVWSRNSAEALTSNEASMPSPLVAEGVRSHVSDSMSRSGDDKKRLIGGIYGLSLGGAFFGESMFSRAPNGSKIALAHLVRELRQRGYSLFDTQYLNDHLIQFGVREIPRGTYMGMLDAALKQSPIPLDQPLS